MFITIDEYYDVDFYNECLNALKNNKIDYKEYINIKPPYNWYIELDEKPIMINYDEIDPGKLKWIVSKTEPMYKNEEYLLKRRSTDNPKDFEKFTSNIVLDETIDNYSCIFRFKNIDQLKSLSKDYGSIWIMGKFRGWSLAISFNEYLQGELPQKDILLEKSEKDLNKPGELEQHINHRVLVKEKLTKKTHYVEVKKGNIVPLKR